MSHDHESSCERKTAYPERKPKKGKAKNEDLRELMRENMKNKKEIIL